MKPEKDILDKLVARILAVSHPLRIILFGSAARGEMGPNSDVDILVVMPDGTNRRKTAMQLYRDIRGIRIGFDLVVATPSILSKYATTPGLVYRNAIAEGKVLYAA